MQNILITGGAGYIGTNLAVEFLSRGCNVVVVDDFKNAYAANINRIKKQYSNNLQIFKANCCNLQVMEDIVKNNNFDVLIHLAAKKYVFESFEHTKAYMHNNIKSLEVALTLASKYKINKFAFASSITVYGEKNSACATENQSYAPTSPYAKTKQLGEQMIINWQAANPNKTAIIFRFTNPISANTSFMLGNNSKQHKLSLPSVVVECALNNKSIKLNGNNHATKDGTPIRDYIHISDLARIVCDVIEKTNNAGAEILNVGCGGTGYSVLQIIKAVENAANTKIDYSFGPKLDGDIACIVCNNKKLTTIYGKQQFANLNKMLADEFCFRKHLNQHKTK